VGILHSIRRRPDSKTCNVPRRASVKKWLAAKGALRLKGNGKRRRSNADSPQIGRLLHRRVHRSLRHLQTPKK
jgi:hypothetical protein